LGSCWLISEITLHTDYWRTGQFMAGPLRARQTTRARVQGWARSHPGMSAGSTKEEAVQEKGALFLKSID